MDKVSFGCYTFDAAKRSLLRSGKPLVLQAKTLDLLIVLLAKRGAVVSREELYGQLWPQGFVEDGNLTQNVYLLRRALDPSGDGRAFVETLPRKGYRFVKPIHEVRPGRARSLRAGQWLAAAAFTLVSGGAALQPAQSTLPPQASIAYSLGLYHLNMRTPLELKRSRAYFEKTVRDAPRSPLGYAGLASVNGLDAEFERDGSAAWSSHVALAHRYAGKALTLDATSAEAHAVTGFLAYRFDENPTLAEREFQRALALDPASAQAHQWHAALRFSEGAVDAALSELELAHQLAPTSEVISRWLGRAYEYQHRPAEAVRILSETIAIEPDDGIAWVELACSQEQGGDLRGAMHSLEFIREHFPRELAYAIPEEARVRALLHRGFADAQTIARMNALLKAKRADAQSVALFYLALNQRNRALAILQSSPPPSPLAASLERLDPRFDLLRSDARFKKLFG